MLQSAYEQIDFNVIFVLQDMAQLMAQHQNADRPDGIHKEGMRSIEGIYITAPSFDVRPTSCLYGSGYLQGQFIKVLFPFVKGYFPLLHQAKQIAIGTGIVK